MRKFLTSIVAFATVFLLFTPNAFAGQSVRDQVVDIAYDYSGSPYVYGGTSPHGFDCSGYTQYVFAKAGIDLNRTSRQQYTQGEYVSRSNLQKGDLVFFGSPIWHVGIYIGNNKMISAENPGDDIQVASLTGYWGRNYAGAKRVIEERETVTESAVEELPAGEYHDVNKYHWAFDHISHLGETGIINGYEGSLFKPDNKVTRAEAATMLSIALDLPTSSHSEYSDVSSSHWASDYINGVTAKGYFSGYEDGTFKPDEPIERAEIAALFTRAFNLDANGSGSFADLSSDHWAYEDIQTLSASSIATGYSDNTFKPGKETIRSEFAVFLYRALYQ
ncbi:hypothetical protein DXT76_06810 [Halobacillus trueperi]|uniref:S-layer homology domain-containing protein n=2 Tax=Halobacillus TaxID=45667 RepID=A0A1H0KLE3_HALAD|nr:MULTISPECIES: C40 family peptidase [Halobacillus]RDY71705.1 hypothetical protein DXT76_06810 [Halobacillus trueperi]SDO56748.1 S-layer homology domain-containing protein [Halobacillus aidingensis]